MRRTAVVATAVSVAALVAVWIATAAPERPPLAKTRDGRFEVHGAVYGRSIEFAVRGDVFRPWTWGDRSRATFPVDRLCVHVRGPHALPAFEAACGCRFLPDMTAGSGGDDRVYATITFPRRDRTLRMRFGPGEDRVAEFPNPFPAPPPAAPDGADELPAETRVGEETWLLSLAPFDAPQFVVRALGADRAGFEWTFVSASVSDASGNRISRTTDGRRAREHRIALPPADGVFGLCPHEPWWEVEVVLDATRSVRWRFRPPPR